MKVKDFMKKDLITFLPDELVKDAARKLGANGVSGGPVIDPSGKLLGMFTEADVLEALRKKSKTLRMIYPSLSMVSVAFVEDECKKEATYAFSNIADETVSAHMKMKVVSISLSDGIDKAAELMFQNHVNRLPVVSRGKVVGIITRWDIVRGLTIKRQKPRNGK